jgi:hypothetical protein
LKISLDFITNRYVPAGVAGCTTAGFGLIINGKTNHCAATIVEIKRWTNCACKDQKSKKNVNRFSHTLHEVTYRMNIDLKSSLNKASKEKNEQLNEVNDCTNINKYLNTYLFKNNFLKYDKKTKFALLW